MERVIYLSITFVEDCAGVDLSLWSLEYIACALVCGSTHIDGSMKDHESDSLVF